jgi:purine-binding chemotaxis protein CheW
MSSPRLPFATEDTWLRRARTPHQHEVLAFSLGDEEYGVDIRRLRGIIRTPPITEVPRAPPFVLGVIGVRGEVLPVVDLRLRLRKPRAAPGPASRVLIARRDDEAFGMVVDAVHQVVRLRDEEIEATPALLGASDSEYIAGIARPWGDRMLILLAVDAVLGFSARRSGG